MATKKKLLQAAAGAAGGAAALNVEDVFSTYLYTGNDTSTAIDNGVDLAGEGGLVWVKARSTTVEHVLYDTERGALKLLQSQSTAAELTQSTGLSSFNSNGFTVGTNGNINGSPHEYASWTFRKAPKFFDVVTYTGNGSTQDISHNLGSDVGMLIIKSTSTGNWFVWHRSLGDDAYLFLNGNNAEQNPGFDWIDVTSTTISLQNNSSNTNGQTYVAYLFAHNDGDGEFGPDGDADIIKCGSYTGNGSTDGPEIDLGFEPQLVLLKVTSQTSNWLIFDNMRGIVLGGNDAILYPDENTAEVAPAPILDLLPTGFKLTSTSASVNGSGGNYIYIAIRRGPMAVPTDATDVFAIATRDATAPAFNSGFPVDAVLFRSNISSAANNEIGSRLTGAVNLETNSTDAEQASSKFTFDYMDGYSHLVGDLSTRYSWMWKRAPSYFDAVAYTGTGANRTVSHNLGVAPEMMWIKQRNTVRNWAVYHSGTGNTKHLELNTSDAAAVDTHWNNTTPTSTEFTLGTNTRVNESAGDYIAYLFASLDGVSKVGSYTGNGSTQNIDCGFSSGARFVLIKGSTVAINWYVFDTERGIVAGNDAELYLDITNAEATFRDTIDPYSSGFSLTGNGVINVSGETYIFYAIA